MLQTIGMKTKISIPSTNGPTNSQNHRLRFCGPASRRPSVGRGRTGAAAVVVAVPVSTACPPGYFRTRLSSDSVLATTAAISFVGSAPSLMIRLTASDIAVEQAGVHSSGVCACPLSCRIFTASAAAPDFSLSALAATLALAGTWKP